MKKNLLITVLCLVFYLCLVSTTWGAPTDYYASPTGTGNTCSSGSPCSLTTGVATVTPGDTLYLMDGTYYQSLVINKSGTDVNNWITVKAQNDGKAIIDGQNARQPCSIPGQIWVDLEGVVCMNGTMSTWGDTGAVNSSDGSHCYDWMASSTNSSALLVATPATTNPTAAPVTGYPVPQATPSGNYYIKVKRVSAYNGGGHYNTLTVVNSFILLEECVSRSPGGSTNQGYIAIGTQHDGFVGSWGVTLRRNVGFSSGDPAFVFYESAGGLMENNIAIPTGVIDNTNALHVPTGGGSHCFHSYQQYDSAGVATNAFQINASSEDQGYYDRILGNIALGNTLGSNANLSGGASITDRVGGSERIIGTNAVIKDNFIKDTSGSCMIDNQGAGQLIANNTCVWTRSDASSSVYYVGLYIAPYFGAGSLLSDNQSHAAGSIIGATVQNNSLYTTQNSPTNSTFGYVAQNSDLKGDGKYGTVTVNADYNNIYGYSVQSNWQNADGTNTHMTNTSPVYDIATYGLGAYLFPPPAMTGVGLNGASIGADIRYGYEDGIKYQDANHKLWPWPMEDRIQKEMLRYFNEHRSITYANDGAGNTGGLWSGTAASHPALDSAYSGAPPPTDTTAPTITAFSVPGTYASLTVPVLTFSASDNIGVVGYIITEIQTPPALGNLNWSSSAPTSYTFAIQGSKKLYAWAKDAAGYISNGVESDVVVTTGVSTFTVTPAAGQYASIAPSTVQTVNSGSTTQFTITCTSGYSPNVQGTCGGSLVGATYTVSPVLSNCSVNVSCFDITLPVVSVFNVTNNNTLVVGLTITATDTVGVTGYLVNESSSTPLVTDPSWATSAPTTYTFISTGTKTLYAWVRDGAGNISASRSVSLTVVSGGITGIGVIRSGGQQISGGTKFR